jgi:hypothetical protein
MKVNKRLGNLGQLFVLMLTVYIDFYDCFKSNPNNNVNKEMTKLSDCSAKFDDGSILDLSSLDNSASPL